MPKRKIVFEGQESGPGQGWTPEPPGDSTPLAGFELSRAPSCWRNQAFINTLQMKRTASDFLPWKETSALSIHSELALFPYQLGKLPCPDKVPQPTELRSPGPDHSPHPQPPSHLQRPDLMRAVRDYQVMNSLASARLSWMGHFVQLPLASCFLEPTQREKAVSEQLFGARV